MQRGSPILTERSGPGGLTAFDRVYREQRVAVERHLLYLTGDRQLAEDLTQETFGRLYERGLPGDDALRNPRAWLLTVASNLAYNHFRAESRRVRRETAPNVSHETDRDDVLDVRSALERLDSRDRTVLLLRHTGFSYAEIAEAVGVAASGVGTILARAQRRFREAYEGAGGAGSKESIEMCYDEGRLLAYLDDEVPASDRAEMTEHIAACDECSATAERLRADGEFAAGALAGLRPGAKVVLLPTAREDRRSAAPAGRPAAWTRYAVVAAVAALVLASFAFAPVRSAAADLLRVFRVQNVQTVNLTEADLSNIQNALKSGSGHVDLESLGEAWIEGGQAAAKPVTLPQAQAAVDFPIVLPKDAPGTPTLTLQPAATYRFKLHVPAINAALETYGSDRVLPDSLDGKVFTVNVPPVVLASYGSSPVEYAKTLTAGKPTGAAPVFVGQTRGPELVVPEGVDAAQLRGVLVNLPFLPQSVRDQLASVKDWQSTLIIPNVNGTARDITIDGVPAVLVSPRSAARDLRAKMGPLPDSATVIWNQGGVIRAVGGAIDEETATNMAKSMMR